AAIAARQAALAEELVAANAARQEATVTLAQAEDAARVLDARLREANELLAKVREERARLAATAEHHDERRVEMARLSGERFQCPPPLLPERLGFDEAVADDPDRLSAELERLQLERERIGPVNLRAETELA